MLYLSHFSTRKQESDKIMATIDIQIYMVTT